MQKVIKAEVFTGYLLFIVHQKRRKARFTSCEKLINEFQFYNKLNPGARKKTNMKRRCELRKMVRGIEYLP